MPPPKGELQVVFDAVQYGLPPPQQFWPTPPQVVHEPLARQLPAPPPPQSVPTVTQVRLSLQQPEVQVLPGQQGCVGMPHWTQMLDVLQALVAS